MKINCQFDFYEGDKKFKKTEIFKKKNVLNVNFCNNECKKNKNWRWIELNMKSSNNIYKFNDKKLTIDIKWNGIWIENFKNSKGDCICKKKIRKNYKMVYHNLSCYNKIKKLLIRKKLTKKKVTKKKLTKKIKK